MPPETNRRQWIYGGLALAVLLGLSFIIGRFSTPTVIQERVRVEKVEVEKQVIVTQEVVRVERVLVQAKARTTTRLVRERREPDGTIERTSETVSAAQSASTAAEKGVLDATQLAQLTKAASSVEDRSKLVKHELPGWRIGLTAGTNVVQRPLPLIWGAEASRRLPVIPLWVGAYGRTSGELGLSLAVEF